MAENGNKLVDRWKTWIVALAVIVPTLFAAFGVRESIQTLQNRVDSLAEKTVQLDAIEARVMRLQREAAQIENIRQDILQAICAANARGHVDIRECFTSPT